MNRAITRTLNLSGTKIQFEVPPHNHPRLPFCSFPEIYNLYDNCIYSTVEDTNVPVAAFGAYIDDWVFYGKPLLQGRLGSINMHISVESMPDFASLFSPRHTEKAIERIIYAYFGPAVNGFDASCRMDWRVIEQGGAQWVNYRNNEIHPEWFWQTPLTDEHLLTVHFSVFNRLNEPEFDQAMLRFCQTIMERFHIQLSADALNQQAEARKQYPHQTLAEFLPKLEWAEKRVEDEMTLWQKIREQPPYAGISFIQPDGSYDVKGAKAQDAEIYKKAEEIIEQQEKTLKETMAKTLASHLDFDE